MRPVDSISLGTNLFGYILFPTCYLLVSYTAICVLEHNVPLCDRILWQALGSLNRAEWGPIQGRDVVFCHSLKIHDTQSRMLRRLELITNLGIYSKFNVIWTLWPRDWVVSAIWLTCLLTCLVARGAILNYFGPTQLSNVACLLVCGHHCGAIEYFAHRDNVSRFREVL